MSDEVIRVEFRTTDIEESLRQEVTMTIKQALIQRALDVINAEYLPQSDMTIAIDRRATTGAQEAAEALRSNCSNQWCQAGAAILDVSHAVFGSESQRSEFLKTKDISVSESFTSERPILQYTTVRF